MKINRSIYSPELQIYLLQTRNELIIVCKQKSFQNNESFFKVGSVVITPRLERALHLLLLQSLQCWRLLHNRYTLFFRLYHIQYTHHEYWT